MKERVLSLSLTGAIEAFKAIRWKFIEDEDERDVVRVEVPRGTGEAYVVELPYEDATERDRMVDQLLDEGFILQAIRITSDW